MSKDWERDLDRANLAMPRITEHMRWVVQTVHQSHHDPGTLSWRDCPMTICRSTRDTLRLVKDMEII